jgi:hypothetical protein
MAVLIEAISVVVRQSAIEQVLPNGFDDFKALVPNNTLCADPELARVGFMSPADTEAFCDDLRRRGFVFAADGPECDFTVVDQLRGPTIPVPWLDFGHIAYSGESGRVAASRLTGSVIEQLMTPDGWRYEDSLSRSFSFVPNEHVDKSVRFLRREGGIDVYFNELTGTEVFIGRTTQ